MIAIVQKQFFIVKQLRPYPKIVLVMTPSGCKMHNKHKWLLLYFE